MCCCYCKSRFSKFPLISGVTKTLSNMVKKFEVNRTISKFSIICSLETFINQRDQTFLARSIRARITREKFLHVQKNVNIHTVKSVKSIRNILCKSKTSTRYTGLVRRRAILDIKANCMKHFTTHFLKFLIARVLQT